MRHIRRILRWTNRVALVVCTGLFVMSMYLAAGASTNRADGTRTAIYTARGQIMWGGVSNRPDLVVTPWKIETVVLSEIPPGAYGFPWETLGFGFRNHRIVGGAGFLEVRIPYWPILAVLLILESIPILGWLRTRTLRNLKPEEVTPVPAWEISDDLPCVHCGYNLRTQSGSGLCPECGSSVADTLTLNAELERSRPGWLRGLAVGNILLVMTRVLLLLVYATSFNGFREFLMPGVLALLAGATYVAGALLVTRREHPHLPSPDRRMGQLQRVLAMASLLCLIGGVFHQTHLPQSAAWRIVIIPGIVVWSGGGFWHLPALMLFLVSWLLYSACVIVEYRFLARLAGRLLDRFMIEHCTIAGIGAAISGVLVLGIVRPIVGRSFPVSQAAFLAISALVVVWGLFLVWTGFMNVYCASRFLKLCWIADERWRRRNSQRGSSAVDAPLGTISNSAS